MRIRSIKPEFWRSDDIAGLSISARLTFIGLWSYVDDNGVGSAKLSSIVADLYAEDMARDPQETLRRVSGDIKELSGQGLIVHYEASGKQLLHVSTWSTHQIVNKPSKGHQYPLPPADMPPHPGVPRTPSGESPETARPGAGEQGNRGTEEQRKKTAPAKPDAAKPKSVEQVATDAAYERVGKAFNYIAVRGIAKWAIHDRGADPVSVENAIVGIYEMGKPITKQVMGQYLDGRFRARNDSGISRQDQKVQTYLNYGRPADEGLREIGG